LCLCAGWHHVVTLMVCACVQDGTMWSDFWCVLVCRMAPCGHTSGVCLCAGWHHVVRLLVCACVQDGTMWSHSPRAQEMTKALAGLGGGVHDVKAVFTMRYVCVVRVCVRVRVRVRVRMGVNLEVSLGPAEDLRL